MERERIIYSLTLEDLFTVANQEQLDMDLSERNLSELEDIISGSIDWYEIILSALHTLKEKGNTGNVPK